MPLVLAVAMALGGANPAIVVSLGGHGRPDSGRRTSNWPPSRSASCHLGLALGTIPAAMLMRRAGRRTGYMVGGGIGVAGGCLAAFGIASASFMIFCLGTFIGRLLRSFVQSYRFAATDTASEVLQTAARSPG